MLEGRVAVQRTQNPEVAQHGHQRQNQSPVLGEDNPWPQKWWDVHQQVCRTRAAVQETPAKLCGNEVM